MICAIYARKSTEQNGVAEEEKSVTRQIEHAKAYAAKKGWRVATSTSMRRWHQRRGVREAPRLHAVDERAEAEAAVSGLGDERRKSGSGREQIQTAYALQQITDAGVQGLVLSDGSGAQARHGDGQDHGLADRLCLGDGTGERRSQRTYDAMLRKAKARHVTGWQVFGYDNVDVYGDELDANGERRRAMSCAGSMSRKRPSCALSIRAMPRASGVCVPSPRT